jgi:hypothetical protein
MAMPSQWLAVGAETDPVRRARELQEALQMSYSRISE